MNPISKDYIKVVYSDSNKPGLNISEGVVTETGWVQLKDGGYYVANIPLFTENLNLFDEVELSFEEDPPIVTKVISRKFHSLSYVRYSELPDFYQLNKRLNDKGCMIEGGNSPTFDKDGEFVRGFAVIAGNISKEELEKEVNYVGGAIDYYASLERIR